MGRKTNGLIALGLAAAALWKWGMKKEDKDKVTDQLKNAGNTIKDKLPQKVKDKYNEIVEKQQTTKL